MEDFTKIRTWAEVDLNALAHNYRALRALTPEGCKFLGLVKANAYGHGAVPVAKKLEELGCDMLAVACVAEAAQLRQAGITLPILCLGYTPVEETEALLRYHVTQTVGDLDTGRALSEAAQRAGGVLDIHVKLGTTAPWPTTLPPCAPCPACGRGACSPTSPTPTAARPIPRTSSTDFRTPGPPWPSGA